MADGCSGEESDAPVEISLGSGRQKAQSTVTEERREAVRLKKIKKEENRKYYLKNREQKEKKRQQLEKVEKLRLSDGLLTQLKMERADSSLSDGITRKGKRSSEQALSVEVEQAVNEDSADLSNEDILPLKYGVQIQTLQKEEKRAKLLSTLAQDFRQAALYSNQGRRISSWQLRQVSAKKQKGGKYGNI